MTKTMLIRHAAPGIETRTPATAWVLSNTGQQAAAALGDKLAGFRLAKLVSSSEPKALQTAQMIADRLAIPVEVDYRLREHERASVGFLDRADFEAGIASIFDNPSAVTFGEESADAVHAHLSAAIEHAREESSDMSAVVTHGTAMSIYVSRLTGTAPMPFWRQLSMPVAVLIEGNRVARVID